MGTRAEDRPWVHRPVEGVSPPRVPVRYRRPFGVRDPPGRGRRRRRVENHVYGVPSTTGPPPRIGCRGDAVPSKFVSPGPTRVGWVGVEEGRRRPEERSWGSDGEACLRRVPTGPGGRVGGLPRRAEGGGRSREDHTRRSALRETAGVSGEAGPRASCLVPSGQSLRNPGRPRTGPEPRSRWER